jgi:hypothetical protein
MGTRDKYNLLVNETIIWDKRTAVANKKYMIIAVSVLIAEFTARNNRGGVRQESTPQSANAHSFERYGQVYKNALPH